MLFRSPSRRRRPCEARSKCSPGFRAPSFGVARRPSVRSCGCRLVPLGAPVAYYASQYRRNWSGRRPLLHLLPAELLQGPGQFLVRLAVVQRIFSEAPVDLGRHFLDCWTAALDRLLPHKGCRFDATVHGMRRSGVRFVTCRLLRYSGRTTREQDKSCQ